MEAPPRIFCCVCALPWPADATCREPPPPADGFNVAASGLLSYLCT